MKWTNEVPTKPGYYWALGLLDSDEPWLVVVWAGHNQLECTIFGDENGWGLSRYAEDIDWWMGPIEVPKKP